MAKPNPNKLVVVQGDMLKDEGMPVIPVNCIPGVMGKGLAKQFADLCPKAKSEHRKLASSLRLKVGSPCIVHGIHHAPVVYFPTKGHWRNQSEIQWIESGLYSLRCSLNQWAGQTIQYPAILMPALGCGLGGLAYEDVHPLIEQFAASLPSPFHVRLYAPPTEPRIQ